MLSRISPLPWLHRWAAHAQPVGPVLRGDLAVLMTGSTLLVAAGDIAL
jgi:hypothetical protein